jgi:hypothetical protein
LARVKERKRGDLDIGKGCSSGWIVACRIVCGKGIGTELPIYENRGVRNEKMKRVILWREGKYFLREVWNMVTYLLLIVRVFGTICQVECLDVERGRNREIKLNSFEVHNLYPSRNINEPWDQGGWDDFNM